MITAKILAKNNDLEGNKEIVAFLKKYLEILINKNVRFQFTIIEDSQIPTLIKYNITNLPACIIGTTPYQGPTKIKSYFMKEFISKVGKPKASRGMTAEETLRAYQDQEMTMEQYEKDKQNGTEEDDVMEGVLARAQEMVASRKRQFEENDKKTGRTGGRNTAANNKRGNNINQSSGSGSGSSGSGSGGGGMREAAMQTGNKDDALLAAMFEETDDY